MADTLPRSLRRAPLPHREPGLHQFLLVELPVPVSIQLIELRFHERHPYLLRYPAILVGIQQKQQLFNILVCLGKLILRLRRDVSHRHSAARAHQGDQQTSSGHRETSIPSVASDKSSLPRTRLFSVAPATPVSRNPDQDSGILSMNANHYVGNGLPQLLFCAAFWGSISATPQ